MITPEIEQEMIAIRRDLHRYPELSWQEKRTTEQICKVLERNGISFRSGIAGTGVVAEIPGRMDGPFIALRADMDALPVQENTGLDYASQVHGVMHACGHDGHTSILLGVAMALTNLQQPPPLPVRLLFQPAEEVAGGAKAMIKEGVLDKVAMIFGAHLDCNHAVGKIVINDGAVSASRDVFRIDITGRGGHAARPQETIDAIKIAVQLTKELQGLTNRQTNEGRSAVVSIGRFEAGTAANIIAETAILEGTIYAQDEEIRAQLKESIKRIAQSIAQEHQAKIEVDIEEGIPAIINRAEIAQIARDVAESCLGDNSVTNTPDTNMGAEDFSCFLQRTRGCYVRIGAWNGDKEVAPAHSSSFSFDEGALRVGAEYLVNLVIAAGKKVQDSTF